MLFLLGGDAYDDGQAISLEGAVIGSALANDLVFFLQGTPQVGGDALLLHDGRFRVEAAWRTPLGEVGAGTPVPLTLESGYFWFFSATNVELVVKVLDACIEPFDRFWVFAAGLTDVEVTLTVTDTLSDQQKVYVNPLGTDFQPIQDTDAFDTCWF